MSKFVVFLILVVFAFACGLNQLYRHYAEAQNSECEKCRASNVKEYCMDLCDGSMSK